MLVVGVLDEENLIVCVVCLLMYVVSESDCLLVGSGVDISIDKCLLMGGGLGGGFFNVVIVLVVFNYLWGCGFLEDELVIFGFQLGVDVLVFVCGYVVFVEGVGEILMLVEFEEKWYLVVYLGVSILMLIIFCDLELL